jgi:predicted transcriptional regulator of viral defense system
MKNSLSEKELGFISKLELKEKYFFNREEIKSNFTNVNEMNVYLYRLKKKSRIIRLNKDKYFLIPVKAVKNHWSEHPFIIIDEIMNGKDYCIVGKAAAHYWKLIEQIPFEYEVFNTKKQEIMNVFNAKINFRKRRTKNIPNGIKQNMYNHEFIIATKEESKKWI